MKNPRILSILLIFCASAIAAAGQDILFFENFDATPGSKPPGWTTALESGDSRWQFVDGGGSKNPEIPGSRRPPSAYSNDVNALYFFESLGGESVMLITPPVNLEFAIRPELHFMHVQLEGNLGFGIAHDELRVYYKTDVEDPWTEVNKIAEYTDAVGAWTLQTVILPEGVKHPQCYFGFKATTNYGWGVCLDDVQVLETDIQPRSIEDVEVFQEVNPIFPSGSGHNPVLRLDLSVGGNSGSLPMTGLEVHSQNTDDADVRVNGVKLLVNHSNKSFNEARVLGTASFSDGRAVFDNLNLELPSGYTYLWVAYDLEEYAGHLHLADAMIRANSLQIGGSTYPSSDASPEGNSMIREAVFFDDFSEDRGWVLTGDFERVRPRGLGGNNLGHADPLHAWGDTIVLGNDLTGLGADLGDYEAGLDRYANLATSKAIDLYYYNDVSLDFLRWLNVANDDSASIEMSLDGGLSWEKLWANDNNLYTDGSWQPTSISMDGAKREALVQVRFNLGATSNLDNFSGWNIENLAVTGNYVEYDVGPVALLEPATGCAHTAADQVHIRVENFGPAGTPEQIPVRYSFDGGASFVSEILQGSIGHEGQAEYTFSTPVDLSEPGRYEVILETALDVDEEDSNNRWDTVLHVDPHYALPYAQDFESGSGFWRVEGEQASFEHGLPLGSVIHTASSGQRAWVTNLNGDYSNNEDSYLIGPCFDFSGIDYPVFECQLYLNLVDGTDGLNLEYSLDNGQNWSRVGNLDEGAAHDWNWYHSDAITSLPGGTGWTSENAPWRLSRIMLDTSIFRNQTRVKFRFRFASDAAGTMEGVAIDDIRIYDVPRDVGVLSIENPADGCIPDLGRHVSLTMKNYGLDTLMAGDTMVVGYRIDEGSTVRDTFLLYEDVLVGGSFSHQFSQELELTSAGHKDIEAFTLLQEDVDFYNTGVHNDTSSKSFDVSDTPFFILPPEIYTVRPDTVLLNAQTGHPADTYLWQDGSTASSFAVSSISDGKYYATASNLYCQYSDTSHVYRLLADVGIGQILEPVTACNPGSAVQPLIRIINHGTDTLWAGEVVAVSYSLDGGAPVGEDALVTSMVPPDSSFEYRFTGAVDMSGVKSYGLEAKTLRPFDNDGSNDALSVQVETYGFTPIDLGADVVVRGREYLIDAGPGYDSYLWPDGSTEQSLLVDTTGFYAVTVQQGSMCANTDTLLVQLVVPDLAVEGLSNPVDGCTYSAEEHVEFYLLNVGTDTLYSNDTVLVTYQMDAGVPVQEELVIHRDIFPGDSIRFTSQGFVDVQDLGQYLFHVSLSWSKDLVPENDVLDQSIGVFEAPVVDLGDDLLLETGTRLLDAGDGFMTHLWQDGSGGQSFLADHLAQTPDSLYRVEIWDVHGCTASDEVKIAFDVLDLALDSLLVPESACVLGAAEELAVRIRNSGTRTLENEWLSVVAEVDGSILMNQKMVSLAPGDSMIISLGSTSLATVGPHTIIGYLELASDGDERNDSLEHTLWHYGYPQPELGGVDDTLETALPHVLDAGNDYQSYLWNGTEGGRIFQATGYGWQHLEVSNEGGCMGGDSIFLMLPTGLEDSPVSASLKLYPLPAVDYLVVEYTKGKTEDLILDLFDSQGRQVLIRKYSQQSHFRDELDLSRLQSGMYFLHLRSEETRISRRIVIQR